MTMMISNITKDICRKCRDNLETIQHITSACSAPLQGKCTHSVTNIVDQELAVKCGLWNGPPMPCQNYEPQSAFEYSYYKVNYDRPKITGPTIHNNRPDMLLLKKSRQRSTLSRCSNCQHSQLSQHIAEDFQNYTDLTEKLIRMWQVKTAHITSVLTQTNYTQD